MPAVRVLAVLPFPLRVDPAPYVLTNGDGSEWELTIERVEREHPDERLVGSGTRNVDLAVDRHGQLSFSRARGIAHIEGAQTEAELVQSFLEVLNSVIEVTRDVLSEYWIRTVAIKDIYYLRVEVDDAVVAQMHAARGKAFTHAVVGLQPEADARLREAIAAGQRPPVWRQIQLDARDALDLGRYEDCVVLGWAALEAACRRALPGLAHQAALTPEDLVRELRRLGGTSARATYSHEGVVRSVSAGLPIVELTAELVKPRIYDPASLRTSVEAAHRLRNVIVHQGARVGLEDAKSTLDAVDFVLNSALPLRHVSPPPPALSWKARFGRVSKRIQDFIEGTGVRLVVWRPPQGANFEWEVFEDDLWLRFEGNVTPGVAEVLLLAEWNAWVRSGSRGEYPHLQVGPSSGILLDGLVSLEADRVEHAVCLTEALQALEGLGITTAKMAGESVRSAVSALAKGGRLQIPDPGLPIRAAQIAAHLSVLPRRGWRRRLAAIRTSQPDVHRLAMTWAAKMAELPHSDCHARCDLLQLISANSAWLDTILVICPIEQVAYGSRRWPLDAAPH